MTIFNRQTGVPSREPFSVPPPDKQDDQAARQVVTLVVELSNQLPKPANEIEQAYLRGLRALAMNQPAVACDQLRDVVESDALWAYSSAKLLMLVLYRALGDASPLASLTNTCLENAPPDKFAQRAVSICNLRVSTHAGDENGIELTHMLLYPAIAARLAAAGPPLQLATAGRGIDKRHLIEHAACFVAAWELTEIPWTPRFNGEYTSDAELARRTLAEILARSACVDYLFIDEPDAALDILTRGRFVSDVYLKAAVLAAKGLTDAALVAYDDAMKDGKKRGMMYQYSARYDKAKLLIEVGDFTRARRELARLYADEPSYLDKEGLLDAVKSPSRPSSRAAIPEGVRHAVWRRDQGQCVQCGSQEHLEFDHVIPVSRGGANTERNLQLLCEQCNRKKSATI